jgi:hypothetical protein
MRSLIPTLGAFGIAMCLLPIRIAADEVLTTPVNVVRYRRRFSPRYCPSCEWTSGSFRDALRVHQYDLRR